MSTNLRLGDDLARALREAAASSGRSQQDIVREAIAIQLGLGEQKTAMAKAVRSGSVKAPEPFRDVEPFLTAAPGTSSLDLLDREDRA